MIQEKLRDKFITLFIPQFYELVTLLLVIIRLMQVEVEKNFSHTTYIHWLQLCAVFLAQISYSYSLHSFIRKRKNSLEYLRQCFISRSPCPEQRRRRKSERWEKKYLLFLLSPLWFMLIYCMFFYLLHEIYIYSSWFDLARELKLRFNRDYNNEKPTKEWSLASIFKHEISFNSLMRLEICIRWKMNKREFTAKWELRNEIVRNGRKIKNLLTHKQISDPS